jgi:hypothetical protein
MQEQNSKAEVAYMTAGELSAVLTRDCAFGQARHPSPDPGPGEAEHHLYPLAECASAYIRHSKSAAQRDRDAFWKAKARSEKERARMLSSENDTRCGRLLDAEEVEARDPMYIFYQAPSEKRAYRAPTRGIVSIL